MMKLSMATPLAAEEPTLTFKFANYLSHLHDHPMVGGVSVFDQVPVHICLGGLIEVRGS
jgi:hypothetical protein